jgi:hypothetical protein
VRRHLEGLNLDIDYQEFQKWLDEKLRTYWTWAALLAAGRPNAKARRELDALVSALKKAQSALVRDSSPSIVFDVLSGGARSSGVNWVDATAALGDALAPVLLAARQAQSAMKTYSHPGRPPMPHRDDLLKAVADRLRASGAGADAAQDAAAEILVACRVPAPEDRRQKQRAVARSRGARR